MRGPHPAQPDGRVLAGGASLIPTAPVTRPRASLGRVVRPLIVVVGVGVIAYLGHQIGFAAILDSIRTLSWRLLVVVCFPYALTATLDAAAWRLAFVDHVPPFAKIWIARLAGEAVNATTPTASVGGEPVKAFLLRHWVPMPQGLASVIVDKTAIVTGQGLFLVLGLVLARTVVPVSGPVLTAMTILLGLEAVGLTGFVVVQLLGAAGRGGVCSHGSAWDRPRAIRSGWKGWTWRWRATTGSTAVAWSAPSSCTSSRGRWEASRSTSCSTSWVCPSPSSPRW
mgnify:CR=1 FL=1